MNVAVCLLLYGLTVAVLIPRPLARVTHPGMAPRLGVAAWSAAMFSVVASWTAAGGFLIAELIANGSHPSQLLTACSTQLRSTSVGRNGVLPQIGLLLLTTLAAVALAVLMWRTMRTLARARIHTHHHATLARIVGRRMAGQDAVVLDAPERLAYCVAGRPHTIVITTGALDALDDRHLAAVLSHERAHLAGRHHLAVALTRALATNMPRTALFTIGAAETAPLLEMCADDAATRIYGSHTVLGALLTLSVPTSIPTGALGASAVDVLARAERLIAPPRSAHRWWTRVSLIVLTMVLLTGPLFIGLLAASGFALCGPASGVGVV